jgi:hypothetical protein
LNFGGSLSRQQGEKEQKETFPPSLRYLHSQDSNTGPNSHLSTDTKENAKKMGAMGRTLGRLVYVLGGVGRGERNES